MMPAYISLFLDEWSVSDRVAVRVDGAVGEPRVETIDQYVQEIGVTFV
jgi:hypothetical protein